MRQIFFSVYTRQDSGSAIKAISFSYSVHKSSAYNKYTHHGMQYKIFILKQQQKKQASIS